MNGSGLSRLGGQIFANSHTADFRSNSFTGGNDVAIMPIPEPNPFAMLAGGAMTGRASFRGPEAIGFKEPVK